MPIDNKIWNIDYESPLDKEFHAMYFDCQEDATHMAIFLENQRIRFFTYKRIDHPTITNVFKSYSLKMGKFGRGLFED